MTLSSAVANYGLSAIATPTGTNVANDVRIGVAPASVGFPTADVAYSFNVTSTGATDTTIWDAYASTVSNGIGSATIADGDGKDFEGVDIPNMITLFSILYTAPTANAGTVTLTQAISVEDYPLPSGVLGIGGGTINMNHSGGALITSSTPDTTAIFTSSGDKLTVTVIGQFS